MTAKEGMRDTTDRGSDKNDEQKTGVSAASPEDDVIDVVIPPSLLGIGAAPDSTLLVQIDPENAQLLELEGSNGAIGRFEADSDKVMLDLKGYQFLGAIHPGPTALVLSTVSNKAAGMPYLKIDGITDEFVTLSERRDNMARLDARVTGDIDASYDVVEEDVNNEKAEGKKSGRDEDVDEDVEVVDVVLGGVSVDKVSRVSKRSVASTPRKRRKKTK